MGEPTAVNISDLIQPFCRVTFSSSEQHIDARSSRITRDTSDFEKLTNFFEKWNPFVASDVLASVTNGIIDDVSQINCHNAFQVGVSLSDNIINTDFASLKFQDFRSQYLKMVSYAKQTNPNFMILLKFCRKFL